MDTSRHVFDAHMTVGPTPFGEVRPEELLALMDAHGIARAVLSPGERWLAVDNEEGNRAIAGWARNWPERFLGYASANPWYGLRAQTELERALDGGLSAIKLHPGRQGFMLLESIVAPILELAARRDVPVYVVTGIAADSMPLQLAEIARRYPQTPFIIGRSGWSDFQLIDLIPAAYQARNLYIETAYNMPRTLEEAIGALGGERVVFASDAPFTNLGLELEKVAMIEVDPACREAILSSNLVRLLGL